MLSFYMLETNESVQGRMNDLDRRLQSLQQTIDAKSKGWYAKWKEFGASISVVGTIISIVVGGYTGYRDFYKRSEGNISPSRWVILNYNPRDHTIEFTFDLIAYNTGNKPELVSQATAVLHGSLQTLTFYPQDFRFQQTELSQLLDLGNRFAIPTDRQIILNCVLSTYLDTKVHSVLFDSVSQERKLLISLQGEARPYKIAFCFRISKSTIKEFINRISVGEVAYSRFLSPICN